MYLRFGVKGMRAITRLSYNVGLGGSARWACWNLYRFSCSCRMRDLRAVDHPSRLISKNTGKLTVSVLMVQCNDCLDKLDYNSYVS